MKERLVPSMWLEKDGRRLDCGPYLSGAIEARILIDDLQCPKRPLRTLTSHGSTGVFNGPRFARRYVDSPEHGVPLLSGTEILSAHLAAAPLISRRQVAQMKYMVLREGTTLVTSYGTVGRTAFVRPDMVGSVGSDNVMKIVPDPHAVRPGYLYSFLSSRFGIPLLLVGSSGSVVTYLDPSRVVDIVVPLAPANIQESVHRLATEAAHLRADASAELRAVVREVEMVARLPLLDDVHRRTSPDISMANASSVQARLDGLFHSTYHYSVLGPLLALPRAQRTTVAELASRVFWPPMFTRVRVEDRRFGVPFFGTSALMRADPQPDFLISKRTPIIEELVVAPYTVLVPGSGQLSGIIGEAVLPFGDIVGAAVTPDAIRVGGLDEPSTGYLFACLSSEYGRRQLKARAFGSSIPHLHGHYFNDVVIPLLGDSMREELGLRAFAVATKRNVAVQREREARALVEAWIGQGGVA